MDELISRKQAIDALWAERMKHAEEMERNLETCSFALRADNKAKRNRVEEDIEIIRQLPSAQPEPCEDAVSRETIKEQMLKYGFRALDMTVTEFVEDCLPSVTPKQRTGKWIKLDMHRGMADHICTACEQECYVPTCMGEPMYAFCPNCGSYNGGEQDDSF